MVFCILYPTSRLYTGIKLSVEVRTVAAQPEVLCAFVEDIPNLNDSVFT